MRTKITILAALVLVTGLASPGDAALRERRDAESVCGTDDTLREQALARHALFERRAARRFATTRARGLVAAAATPEVRKEGNVLVVIDSGQLIAERNPVDLDDFSMRFLYKRRKGGYLVKPSGGAFSQDFGELLRLSDDDSIRLELPFKVKFFGESYGALWVNSDGNITFDEPDSESTARDLRRVLTGPPRVLPFFRDLDPERVPGGGGVFARVAGSSVTITWYQVPEFGDASRLNTFQVAIAKNGRINFRYLDLESGTAVVGIAPGGGSALDLLDFTEELPSPLVSAAVAETFARQNVVDEIGLNQTVSAALKAQYDQYVYFTDFIYPVIPESPLVIAFELTFRNLIAGIGDDLFDFSDFFGGDGVLESYVMMGDIGKYGPDVEERGRFISLFSGLEVLLHEVGHRWGVRTLFRRGGATREDLLGRFKVHWSYCSNSESYIEGNVIAENGDGTFTTLDQPRIFNPIDRYMMGYLAAADVPDIFYVDGCNGDRPPSAGDTFGGDRVEVSIDQIRDAMGERAPAAGRAPRKHRVAFVLLVARGEEPRRSSLDLMNDMRSGATRLYRQSGGRLVSKLKLR